MESLKVEFFYDGQTIDILCSEKELMKNIVEKFCVKVSVDKNSINCLYGGKILEENTTLENLIKLNILKRLTEEVKHSLIYYPPCDAVDFFKSIIHYLKDQLFSVDLKIYQIGYSCLAIYKVKVLEISYEDIIKDNNTIIFKNVNTTSYMLFYDENPDDYDKDIER